MSVSIPYHDPTVPTVIIERYKLAYLMQFFVQHKQRFRFPRVRLQDLYKLLETHDIRPLAYLIVQILRFLKVPNATIITVEKALDIFTSEKRTSTRVCIHQLRSNRQIHELNAENKAKLLENLIETVYDELPDFNFAPNGFNSGNNSNNVNNHSFCGDSKSLNDIKQEENTDDSMNELAIKAGSDSRGSSYVYLDDLRLYREKPQSSLSTQWDVVVGPTIDQWQNFIRSLGNHDEEGDLKAFLQDHLLEIVCTSLNSGELMQDNPELYASSLLHREQSEFNGGSSDYYTMNTNKLSNSSNNLYDNNEPCGGSAGASINHGMTCLDQSGAMTGIKQEISDTSESYSGSYINSGMMPHNQHVIPRSNSYPGSQIPMTSPLHGSVSSPAQSAHGGPLTPSGDSTQMKTSPRIASGQAWEPRIDNCNIPISYPQPHQNLYHPSQHMPEMIAGGPVRYQTSQRLSCPNNGPMMMMPNNLNGPLPGPSQVMVFTTQMANDAALEHARHRTPIYQFHNTHQAVADFIQSQCNPNRLIGLQKPFENLTQKQLENRKNKMAKLEQIQSTLSKTKAQSSSNVSNVVSQSSSTASTITTATTTTLSDIHTRPLSSNQMPTSIGLESNSGVDNSIQDVTSQSISNNNNNGSGMLSDNTLLQQQQQTGQCHQFPNEQPMQGQYIFNSTSQMSAAEQQMMMAGDANNPPTSEAALRQWELLRLEYMREKQSHDVMSNRFQSLDMASYAANGNGAGKPVHRPNIIRQPFPPQQVPMEPSGAVMYPSIAGVKRPYQLIGAPPPPPGYHTHPIYNHHHESMVNQRAMLMQQQQQQPRGPPPICDPSWNMIHPNYPHISSHLHPMQQNFPNMYPHHRGPTPPTALGLPNGPMPPGQNASSNSSTTTTTSTSSKSKSKKRKSTAKSTSTCTNSSTTLTSTTSMSNSLNSSLSHTSVDMKPSLQSSNLGLDVQNQRFANSMMTGISQHDDVSLINRSMPSYPDQTINGTMVNRGQIPESQVLSNSLQMKNELMSPNKSATFSPLGDIKPTQSINSSNHLTCSSINTNSNFSSNPNTAYCSSSSISSTSQNLTSASLASLARLSSQMSGGSDSPLFNSLQSQPTTHSLSSSSSAASASASNVMLSKINSANSILHSMPSQPVPDPQMSMHQISQQSNNGPYHSGYAPYRHPVTNLPAQPTQQHNSMNNTNNNVMQQQQQHDTQTRQTKSNQSAMINLQPTTQIMSQQPLHQTSHEMMYSPYQSYSNQQTPNSASNPANTLTNCSASNNPNIIPGVAIQPSAQHPPSIMVNNTFVNAQLNVQQMNYQHLAAPNVNAQMQIQQQHQAIQPSTLMNLDTPMKQQSEMTNVNPPITVNQSNDSLANQSNNITVNAATQPTTGFINNSNIVQIQSKTPHTIQYMPAEHVPIGVGANTSGTNNNTIQGDLSTGQAKYTNVSTPSLELDELISSKNKQMIFQGQNHELSTGGMSNIQSNNVMMMGQPPVESPQYRFQQHQRQMALRPTTPCTIMPQGTMIMRQTQSQQHVVLQQPFSGSNATLFDHQMKQQQMQRLMMVNNNNNQLCQQQQQQHIMMSGQLPVLGHPHYVAMESGSQEQQQHIYHQQQFIAMQQQQQQIRQQSQGPHFG